MKEREVHIEKRSLFFLHPSFPKGLPPVLFLWERFPTCYVSTHISWEEIDDLSSFLCLGILKIMGYVLFKKIDIIWLSKQKGLNLVWDLVESQFYLLCCLLWGSPSFRRCLSTEAHSCAPSQFCHLQSLPFQVYPPHNHSELLTVPFKYLTCGLIVSHFVIVMTKPIPLSLPWAEIPWFQVTSSVWTTFSFLSGCVECFCPTKSSLVNSIWVAAKNLKLRAEDRVREVKSLSSQAI